MPPHAAALQRANSWTAITGLLALTACLAGLLLDGVYSGAASTAEMLRAYDVVTAAAVVPGLAVATWMAHHGSVRAPLMCLSLLAYLGYTYAYYVFGTGFNDLFLLHAGVLGAGLVALVLQAASTDVASAARQLPNRTRVGVAAVVLALLAIALCGMWAFAALDNAVTGRVPTGSRLVETDSIVHLGMALDLALLVPLYAAGAILLWRHSPWGYVLGTVSLVAGLLHQLTYTVAMPFQVTAHVPGAVSYDPGEPFIVLLYLIGGVALLSRRTSPDRGPTSGTPVGEANVLGLGLR